MCSFAMCIQMYMLSHLIDAFFSSVTYMDALIKQQLENTAWIQRPEHLHDTRQQDHANVFLISTAPCRLGLSERSRSVTIFFS